MFGKPLPLLDFHVRIRLGFQICIFSKKLVTQNKLYKPLAPATFSVFLSLDKSNMIPTSYVYYFLSDTQTTTNILKSKPKSYHVWYGRLTKSGL